MKNKTLFVGGPLDGKKEFIDEFAEFKSQRYVVYKPKKFRGIPEYFKYGCDSLHESVEIKTVYYYPKRINVSSPNGEVRDFMFMVNDPHMSEVQLMEKLISGHRSMKK